MAVVAIVTGMAVVLYYSGHSGSNNSGGRGGSCDR